MDIIHSTFGPRLIGDELQEHRIIEGAVVKIEVRRNGGPFTNSFARATVLHWKTRKLTDLKIERLESDWVSEAAEASEPEAVMRCVAEELAEDMRVLLSEAREAVASYAEEFQGE